MSPEARRIAIAEACGWKGAYWSTHYRDVLGAPPNAHTFPEVPDYLNDLNAMYEAESLFEPRGREVASGKGRWVEYGKNLCLVCGFDDESHPTMYAWNTYRATAAQRCEAFLRTIGKWEDDK